MAWFVGGSVTGGDIPDYPFERINLKELDDYCKGQSDLLKELDPGKKNLIGHWSPQDGVTFPEIPLKPFEIRLSRNMNADDLPKMWRGVGYILVDDEIRALLEKIDPGLHQFIPLVLLLPNGKEFGARAFYCLNVGVRRDTLDKEKSDGGIQIRKNFFLEGHPEYEEFIHLLTSTSAGKIFVRKDAVGNHGIWMEETFRYVMISDYFYKALDEIDALRKFPLAMHVEEI